MSDNFWNEPTRASFVTKNGITVALPSNVTGVFDYKGGKLIFTPDSILFVRHLRWYERLWNRIRSFWL